MYSNILQTISTGWNPMRIVRAVLSAIILIQALVFHDGLLALFGGWFLLMAVFNTGCCAGGACSTPVSGKTGKNDAVEFEEIK